MLLNTNGTLLSGMLEIEAHIKTQPSYHHPGPPYTYQGPKISHET